MAELVCIDEPRICALLEVNMDYTEVAIDNRVRRREGSYDFQGRWVSRNLPKFTRTQLLHAELNDIIETAQNDKPVLVYSNGLEDVEWLNMLRKCPYAKKCFTVKSQMDNYYVTQWLITGKPRKRKAA